MAAKSDGTGMRPEPSPTPNAVSRTTNGGYKIALQRSSTDVLITVTSRDEYSSIELYDRLLKSVKSGSLCLEMEFSN